MKKNDYIIPSNKQYRFISFAPRKHTAYMHQEWIKYLDCTVYVTEFAHMNLNYPNLNSKRLIIFPKKTLHLKFVENFDLISTDISHLSFVIDFPRSWILMITFLIFSSVILII